MTKGEQIILSSRKMLGKPYRWGGNYPPISDYLGTAASDGTDCSGLVQWAYNDAGYPLDNTVRHTTWTLVEMGESVSLDINAWKAGDLLFNPTCEHVQIYTGNNSVIEAQQDGVPIKESSLWMEVADVRRLVEGEGGITPPDNNFSEWFIKYGAKPLYYRRLGRC